MYPLIPITDKILYYKTKLKILKDDSKHIINNLDILQHDYIGILFVDYKYVDDYVIFTFKCNDKRKLQVFFFKISSIANDSFIRRKKIEKKI